MELKKYFQVRYLGCSEHQMNWGGCDNPLNKLYTNHIYTVVTEEVHPLHTKYKLLGIAGKFNSVCFEKLKEK